ncbi:GNAT family N-acetyltransferase [Dictyobacter arantiisoli]|uniref:Ribosomal-protein-serine acetyltransferase n=1 Tax=Dictyobacter arantiisoli TaxID=2014874 RepID=A0A5A5T974_9CHLR|nr:GNAT family protein [Dictyobacter arantiisoli]GCF07583.1 ribosomal-protein-serine acetyltransferase [Dictyobacter arantiisoli]
MDNHNQHSLSLQVNEDVQLKLLEERHSTAYYELTDRNRRYLREWMGWLDEERSVEQTCEYIAMRLQQYIQHQGFLLGIYYQQRLVGSIGLHALDWSKRKGEIGYWLDAGTQRQGVMTDACRALTTYAFDEYQLNKVEIHCGVGNLRSRRIPERLGYKLEGIVRQNEWLYDHYIDHAIYGMLAGEWDAEKTFR